MAKFKSGKGKGKGGDSKGKDQNTHSHIPGSKLLSSRPEPTVADIRIATFTSELRSATEELDVRAKATREAYKDKSPESIAQLGKANADFNAAIGLHVETQRAARRWLQENRSNLTSDQIIALEGGLEAAEAVARDLELSIGRKPKTGPEPDATPPKREDVASPDPTPPTESQPKKPRKKKSLVVSPESKEAATLALREQGITEPSNDLVEALARRRDTYIVLQEANVSGDENAKKLAAKKDVAAHLTLKARAELDLVDKVERAWKKIKDEVKSEVSVRAVKETPEFAGAQTHLAKYGINDPEIIAAFMETQIRYEALQDFRDGHGGRHARREQEEEFTKLSSSFRSAQTGYRKLCEEKGIDYKVTGEPALHAEIERINAAHAQRNAIAEHQALEAKRSEFAQEIEELKGVGIDNLAIAKALRECKDAYEILEDARKGEPEQLEAANKVYNDKRKALTEQAGEANEIVAGVWDDYKKSDVKIARHGIEQNTLERADYMLNENGIENVFVQASLARVIKAYEAQHLRPEAGSAPIPPPLHDAYINALKDFRKSCNRAEVSEAKMRGILDEVKEQVQAKVDERLERVGGGGYTPGEGAHERVGNLLKKHGVENQAVQASLTEALRVYEAMHLRPGAGSERIPKELKAAYIAAKNKFKTACKKADLSENVGQEILDEGRSQVQAEAARRRRGINGGVVAGGAAVVALAAASEGQANAAVAPDENQRLAAQAIATTLGLETGDESLVGALAALKVASDALDKTGSVLSETPKQLTQIEDVSGRKPKFIPTNSTAHVAAQSEANRAQVAYRVAREHFKKMCEEKGISSGQAEIIEDRMRGKYYSPNELAVAQAAKDRLFNEWIKTFDDLKKAEQLLTYLTPRKDVTDARIASAKHDYQRALLIEAEARKKYLPVRERSLRMARANQSPLLADLLKQRTAADLKGSPTPQELEAEKAAESRRLAQYTDAKAREAEEALAKAQAEGVSSGSDLAQKNEAVTKATQEVEVAKAIADGAKERWVHRRVNKKFEEALAGLSPEVAARIRESEKYLSQVDAAKQGVKDFWGNLYDEMAKGGEGSDIVGNVFTDVLLDGTGRVGDAEDLLEAPETAGVVMNHAVAIAHDLPGNFEEVDKRIEQTEADGLWAATVRFQAGGEVRNEDELAETTTGRLPSVAIPFRKAPAPSDSRVAETPQLNGSKSSQAAWTAIEQNSKRREISNFTPAVEGVEVCEPDETLMSVDPSLTPVTATGRRVS